MADQSSHLIYGVQPLIEAFEANRTLEKIFLQRDLKHEKTREIVALAKEKGVPVSRVPLQKLQRFTRKNHQGVVAFASEVDYVPLNNIIAGCYENGEYPFILILDRITDVRNFGAICRSAECVGVHGVVVPKQHSALISGDAIRTSAGAINHLSICRENDLSQTVKFLQESGVKVFACTEKAEAELFSTKMEGPTAIIMGSEEDGISGSLLRLADEMIKIPMEGKVSSLNVSVATGVILFEAYRQMKLGSV